MDDIRSLNEVLAVQTLADFEDSGFGHFLDNSDADVLREMVRITVKENKELRQTLITAMVKLHSHVTLSGTTFEEYAAKLTRVELSPSFYNWEHQWQEAERKR